MKHAAIGFRVHSGWAVMVAVSLESGEPRVLLRQRPHLVKRFTYEFRQPYHTAERMPFAKSRTFIARMEDESRELAEKTVRDAQAAMRDQGFELTSLALLLASGRALPSLDKILASHALIHTADGEHFRSALRSAGEACGLAALEVPARDLLATASKRLGIPPKKLTAQLIALGKPLGPPWSQDEKFATLAAWLALHRHKKA